MREVFSWVFDVVTPIEYKVETLIPEMKGSLDYFALENEENDVNLGELLILIFIIN